MQKRSSMPTKRHGVPCVAGGRAAMLVDAQCCNTRRCNQTKAQPLDCVENRKFCCRAADGTGAAAAILSQGSGRFILCHQKYVVENRANTWKSYTGYTYVL